MHPDPRFAVDDAPALLAEAARIGFAHIVVAAEGRPMVVHAPVTLAGERLRFHVARANRVFAHLDGAAVLASIAGADGYISPNWYTVPSDQVPTWNYTAIEVEGRCRMLDEPALIEQLDALAATHEPRVNPAAPWSRAKVDPARFDAMLPAIAAFEIAVTAVRGTTKLSQNKRPADRAGVVAGLTASGNTALAAAMAA